MLMNTLPTRVDADRTAAVGPWLRTAHDRLLDLQDRVHTGLSDIRRAVGIARGKLFTSLFVFRNFNAEPPVVTDGLTTKGVDVGVVNNGYPLSFTADLDDSLRFALRFDRSFYTNRSVERLADRMLDLLALLAAAEPTEVLGDLLPVPAPAPQIEEEHEASAAPVTGERLTGPARTLKQIWDAVLGIDDVDPDENFFHVGGDSILAFEVAGRARREGITVTVQQILKLRTFNKILDAIGVGKAEVTVARAAASASGDPQIDAVLGAMAKAAVPGVGVAIIEGGRLLRAFGAGVTKAGGRIPVTAETAFQVCSVSKHVAALGALRLVGDGVLDLDVDIRDYLDGWHPPRDDDGPPLTVRRLLSHTSGLNQLPNFGVPRSAPRAELLDILRGQEPAKNPPIRVEFPPSDEFRYSGANFAVLQLILGEVTGEPFAELMRELVFTPLEMTNSSFDQAFPLRRAGKVALGHQDDGGHLPGGWHVYTTAAASGLWTTPTDLARLACDVMRTLRDGDGVLLGTAEAAEMQRPLPGVSYGLGSVAAEGGWFGHSGDGPGFQALTLSTAGDDDGGRGVVIMANRAGRLEFVVDLMVELGFSVPVTRDGVAPVGAPAQGVVA
jgi:CubicO group peptidase (beta-lactamase class C family)